MCSPLPSCMAMNIHCLFALLALFIAGLGLHAPSSLYAHGAVIEYSQTTGIALQAKYDTGQPMPKAQVAVYAPDNPAKPWLTGTSDEQGRFRFVPDPAKPGTWSVQARLAGHGAMVHILIKDGEPAKTTLAATDTGQRGLMAASVVWGCIGTALYFKRRRSA